MTTISFEIISTSLNDDSQSRRLAQKVARALRATGVTVGFTDARTLTPTLCDGRSLDTYPVEYGALARRIEHADAIVISTPVYNFGPSGPCANLLAIVGDALAGKPMAIVSASGSERSHLAIAPLMVSLIFECGAFIYPKTVQVAGGEEGPDLEQRIEQLALGFHSHVQTLSQARVAADQPTESSPLVATAIS